MKNTMRTLFLATALAGFGSAQAAVVNSADVAGLKTFSDTNTGRVWLDINNFFDASSSTGLSPDAMITAAQNAGFSFATKADVEQLLNSLPLSGGEWSSYSSVMGYGIPRQLIWGVYDNGGSTQNWAWSWSGDTNWSFYDNSGFSMSVQPNQGSSGDVDLGIWAYQTGTPVAQTPIPAAVWLFGSALAGLTGLKRRKTS